MPCSHKEIRAVGVSPAQEQLHGVCSLAASYGAFAALKHDSTVVTWGDASWRGAPIERNLPFWLFLVIAVFLLN